MPPNTSSVLNSQFARVGGWYYLSGHVFAAHQSAELRHVTSRIIHQAPHFYLMYRYLDARDGGLGPEVAAD